MHVWNVLHAARWKYRTQKNRHLGSIAKLCVYIFATKACINKRKKFLKWQYLLHMSPQYGELGPTNGWDLFSSLGTPANFNAFHVLASVVYKSRYWHSCLATPLATQCWRCDWSRAVTWPLGDAPTSSNHLSGSRPLSGDWFWEPRLH